MRLLQALWILPLAMAGCSGDSDEPAAGGAGGGGSGGSAGAQDASRDPTASDVGADKHEEAEASTAPFATGNIYIAGARNALIFEYELIKGSGNVPGSLKPVTQWSDPSFYPDYNEFAEIPSPNGQPPARGPSAIAFDGKGHLVVAGLKKLCVFSAPGVLVACHDKHVSADAGAGDAGDPSETTASLLFDPSGNLILSPMTGSRDHVSIYDSSFKFVREVPVTGGDTAGVACTTNHDLFVVTQQNTKWPYSSKLHTLTATEAGDGYEQAGSPIAIDGLAESILVVDSKTVLAACHDDQPPDAGIFPGIRRIDLGDGGVGTPVYDDPGGDAGLASGLILPKAVTVDSSGNVYTADWQNALGTTGADLYVFSAKGAIIAQLEKSNVYGPASIAVAGTKLYCGPPSQ